MSTTTKRGERGNERILITLCHLYCPIPDRKISRKRLRLGEIFWFNHAIRLDLPFSKKYSLRFLVTRRFDSCQNPCCLNALKRNGALLYRSCEWSYSSFRNILTLVCRLPLPRESNVVSWPKIRIKLVTVSTSNNLGRMILHHRLIRII